MSGRASPGGGGYLAKAAFVLCCAVVAWIILSHAASGGSGRAEILVREATVALDRNRIDDAERVASRAIDASPMRPQAVMMMIAVRQRQGRNDDAGRLVSAMGFLGWRDPTAQAVLLASAEKQGNFQSAVLRMDAILRQTPRPAQLVGLPRQLADHREAIQPIIDRLAAAPGWRRPFLAQLSDLKRDQYAAHLAILRGLKASEAPPASSEIAAFSKKLVGDGGYVDAAQLWASLSGHRPGGLDTGSPFDWSSGNVPGLSVTAEDDGTGIAMTTEGNIAGRALERLVLLPPGPHRLKGRFVPIEGAGPRRLRWSIVCAGGGADLRTGLPADQGMGAFDVEFGVPQGCPAVQIGVSLGQLTASTASFALRNFAIE